MANIAISEITQEISDFNDLDGDELIFITDVQNGMYSSKKITLGNIKSYIENNVLQNKGIFKIGSLELRDDSLIPINGSTAENAIPTYENCILETDRIYSGVGPGINGYSGSSELTKLTNCTIKFTRDYSGNGQTNTLDIYDYTKYSSGVQSKNGYLRVIGAEAVNNVIPCFVFAPKSGIEFLTPTQKATVVNGEWLIESIS